MNAISLRDLEPGELAPDGSYLDVYGFKHYPYGAKYKYSPADKRLKANGSHAGKHEKLGFSEEEIASNPFLGLKPKDYKTLLLYLNGQSRREIASDLGISEMTVTTRMAKPSVKRCLAYVKGQYDEDLHSLTELAVDAVRDGLTDDSITIRLQSADRVFKTTGRMDKKAENVNETATSQIHKLLAAVNIKIDVHNNSDGRPTREANQRITVNSNDSQDS